MLNNDCIFLMLTHMQVFELYKETADGTCEGLFSVNQAIVDDSNCMCYRSNLSLEVFSLSSIISVANEAINIDPWSCGTYCII